MQTLIASDDAATAERLRAGLAAHGVACPVSRLVSLDAAIGALAREGAELVLIVASSAAERSIILLQELRRRSSAALVVIGSAKDPNLILRIVHAGPDDYLDIDEEFAPQLQRTLERLRASAPSGEGDGRLITVVSHSGGCGCSFVAANLAAALAREHSRCAVCDFNQRRGDLATLFNLKPRHSVSDLLRNVSRLDRGVLEQALTPHECGAQLLAAPTSLADVQPMSSEVAEQIVRLLKGSFPYIVVDLEDFFHAEQIQLLRASSTVCFVLRLDFTALRNTRRTLEYLDREGIDLNRVQILVNQYGRPKEIAVSQAEKVLDRKLSLFVPFDQRTVVSSLNRGIPVTWELPKSKIAKSFARIVELVSQPSAVTA